MTYRLDLTGERFGRLVAVEFSHRHVSPGGSPASMWLCRCDCGKESIHSLGMLRSGQAKSCGCGIRDAVIRRCTTHGQSKAPEYNVWRAMKRRCYTKNDKNFHLYGGRGIKVCDQWKNDFNRFLDDVGPRPSSHHTLDRIDSSGNYEPSNVRWASRKEQSRNRRCVKRVPFRGMLCSSGEIAEQVGLNRYQVFYQVFRMKRNPDELWGAA